jgi:hypothetical protein
VHPKVHGVIAGVDLAVVASAFRFGYIIAIATFALPTPTAEVYIHPIVAPRTGGVAHILELEIWVVNNVAVLIMLRYGRRRHHMNPCTPRPVGGRVIGTPYIIVIREHALDYLHATRTLQVTHRIAGEVSRILGIIE